ncbi:MAG TPA: agmatinase [Ktedonobacteraceae bacterium]|nr:agmatinase [Ktedonobacteraceae bacterium]
MNSGQISQSAGTVSLLGIPFDAHSSYLRGPALAPARMREALYNGSSNLWTEDGMDLSDAFHDAGDLAFPADITSIYAEIERVVRDILALGYPLICLGGDHSITYPIMRGFQGSFADITILHFDAHPDLYDDLDGPLSHACQFARIMEDGLARRLVQVGIRTINGHQLEQAQKFGVEVITMRNLARLASLKLEGPLYISFDLDVLDPAFAPGVSHYEAGGMSVREVLTIIQELRVPIVGADIVEYNPIRDHQTQTAMVCGKMLKEITAAMLRRGNPPTEGWV